MEAGPTIRSGLYTSLYNHPCLVEASSEISTYLHLRASVPINPRLVVTPGRIAQSGMFLPAGVN